MIIHNEQICYGPYPPLDYTKKTEAGNRLGLVKFYADDLALWNLIWLIEPKFDEYLNPNLTTKDYARMADEFDQQKLGFAQRALNHEDELEPFGEPTLRSLLTGAPRNFMRKLAVSSYRDLALFQDYGSRLVDAMWGRARLSEPEGSSNGNILRPRFGGDND